MDRPVLVEGGTDLAERLGGDALADAIVGLDSDGLDLISLGVSPLNFQRSDLLVEETFVLGLHGLLV